MLNADWNKGFRAGSKNQRIKDIEQFASFIENLDIKGIGDKTKERIIKGINKAMSED